MASRAWLLTLLAVCACLAPQAAPGRPATASALYTVRVDPRLCPSPRCGGYWVALANGARTRCADGLRHPRCYIAVAVGPRGEPLGRIAGGALVRGAIELGPDDLGQLVAEAVFVPAGRAKVRGGYYRVRDTGIRCIRAPCFSYRATQVNGFTRTRVSGVDVAAAKATAKELARANAALRTQDGLYARGRISTGLDGGRTFHALRLYLRAPLPRA
jgi:hypothetical protein